MGVSIAIIDSGVNPRHFHVQGVESGLAFCPDSNGQIIQLPDFSDELGHGTAIAGVIRNRAPSSRLHAVKIFHKSLGASASTLFAAMEWAIESNMKIIHLSLGTEREQDEAHLRQLCREAYDRSIVIIAAAGAPDDRVFPAVFETVIGAYRNRDCGEDALVYHPANPIEFGAHGQPRPLPGRPQELNFRGSSFAAAHVTARVAQLLEKNPDAGTAWVKETLAKAATCLPFE